MRAARVIRAGHQHVELFIDEFGGLDQRNAGVGNLAQVMTGDFSGQAHRNTAGTIEQRERQACGQLAWLFKRAVVVRHEVNRAVVQLIEQQRGNAGQARFGVTHRSCTITVAGTKITLAIDQRVPLAEVLRHADHGIVSGLVAVRVVLAENVPHDTRTFNRLGAIVAVGATKGQAHARHAVQNTPLHRFLAIAGIRQRSTLDHAEGVFKVGALGVSG